MGKLFWKFLAFLFLAQLSTIAGVAGFFWLNQQHALAENAGVETSRPAVNLVQAASSTLEFGGKNALVNLLQSWQKHPMPQVFAIDNQGEELLGRHVTANTVAAANKLAQKSERHPESHRQYAYKVNAADGQTYLLFVPDLRGSAFFPPPPEMGPPKMGDRPLVKFPRFPFLPLLAISIVSLLFAAFIAWYFSKPINHLRNALMQAANGHLSTRIGGAMNHRRDELADLGRDFDTMAGRLDSLIQGQRRLLHHVSHELRSPLARIQIAIGLAKQSHDKVDASLDRIQADSERMDALIGELLQLSKLESGTAALKREKVELSHLLKNLAADAAYEAAEHNILIKQVFQSNLIVFGDAELLYRAIENIVRNAIKYSPTGSEISIALFKNQAQKTVRLSVSDQGSGVPDAELDAIFQPFMRSSHAQSKDGYGVGLAIAKQIIEAHGGKIKAENLQPKGFQMQIDLPVS